MMKECKFCGKEFEPRTAHQIYCGKTCNGKAQKAKKSKAKAEALAKTKRICKHKPCGKEFTPKRGNQACCSEACTLRRGRALWKLRNKERYRQSELERLKRKYAEDPEYAESRREKSNSRYHSLTPQQKAIRNQAYRDARDPDEVREYMRNYHFERNATDPIFKLRNLLRGRVRSALKADGGRKKDRTEELLGCTIEEAKKHIESQFEIWMDWENWTSDGWVLDHIRPCASFNLLYEDEQLTCFNYRNLQPIAARDNNVKNDDYSKEDELKWSELMLSLGFEGDLFLLYDD